MDRWAFINHAYILSSSLFVDILLWMFALTFCWVFETNACRTFGFSSSSLNHHIATIRSRLQVIPALLSIQYRTLTVHPISLFGHLHNAGIRTFLNMFVLSVAQYFFEKVMEGIMTAIFHAIIWLVLRRFMAIYPLKRLGLTRVHGLQQWDSSSFMCAVFAYGWDQCRLT